MEAPSLRPRKSVGFNLQVQEIPPEKETIIEEKIEPEEDELQLDQRELDQLKDVLHRSEEQYERGVHSVAQLAESMLAARTSNTAAESNLEAAHNQMKQIRDWLYKQQHPERASGQGSGAGDEISLAKLQQLKKSLRAKSQATLKQLESLVQLRKEKTAQHAKEIGTLDQQVAEMVTIYNVCGIL